MSWAGLEVNRSLPNNNIGQPGLIKTLRAEGKAISFSMSFYCTKNENDITKMAVKLFQGLPTLIVWIHTLARRQVKYENQISSMKFSHFDKKTVFFSDYYRESHKYSQNVRKFEKMLKFWYAFTYFGPMLADLDQSRWMLTRIF